MLDQHHTGAYTRNEIETLVDCARTASCGRVTLHVSGTDDATDLEYRGRDGKWTLATVVSDNPDDAPYLAHLFNHGVAIIEQLLATLDHLSEDNC